MTSTIARMKAGGKHYEIVVDLDTAIKIKRGESKDVANALLMNDIFHNSKNGEKASDSDLEKAFGGSDIIAVAEKIIKRGEIQLPKEHVDSERGQKKKRVIDWYVQNAVDAKTGRPFTPEIISDALNQSGANIDNRPVEQQISILTPALSKILPLKVETKKLIITIPAVHTGKAYSVVNKYREKEEWLSNGDLKVAVNIPLGLQSEFYDKLNAITHGAAITEEVEKTE